MNVLLNDMAIVRTSQFFRFARVADEDMQRIDDVALSLSQQYVSFVRRLGTAKLYRTEFGGYNVIVDLIPCRPYKHTGFLLFGSVADGPDFFFRCVGGVCEPEIYLGGGGAYRVTDYAGFDGWLDDVCTCARRTYTKRQWDGVVKGPRPFSTRERLIVEARSLFVVERADFGEREWRATVRNMSDVCLPCLSIGVKSRDGGCYLTRFLDVSHIKPGEAGEVMKAPSVIGKHGPTDFELCALPDPGPEDRRFYCELRRRK